MTLNEKLDIEMNARGDLICQEKLDCTMILRRSYEIIEGTKTNSGQTLFYCGDCTGINLSCRYYNPKIEDKN